ncbi:protein kinase [Streptosporangium sp. NPDC051023]|uniref:serine/threonine-protein kinase n=1 Tax=Streptosporangium sp. NPDC051023 TaxID=3155410 RepID=UPI00344DC225
MPEQQTRVLADRYELIAPLGRGTMGTVWRAHDRSLGREVAIKEIRQEPGLSEAQRAELRERMIREGRTAARISHPSVATVHDAIVEGDSPWIIMELVQARSLEQVIEEEGPLPPRLVAEIGVDLLGALRAAHDQGVLHRDVKPGNVLITESGRVVLTDFGIAKAEGDSSLTKTGMVIGSPGYTAPERARGEHTGPESDLWSLGATLYFAVEGRPAYERSSVAETLAALMTDKADTPTQAGPLRPVLEQLLERDYTVRPSHALAIAMLRTVADTPTSTPASTPASTAPAPAAPAASTMSSPSTSSPSTEAAGAAGSSTGAAGAAKAQSTGAAPAKPAGATAKPASSTAKPAGTAAKDAEPLALEGASEDEGFDADRTVLVIRPKGGLRLPPGPGSAAAPSPSSPAASPAGARPEKPVASAPRTPVAGRPAPSGLGTPVAGPGLAASGAPAAPGRGFPPAPGHDEYPDTAPHAFPAAPGPGAPRNRQPEGPGGASPNDRPGSLGGPSGAPGAAPQGPWQPAGAPGQYGQPGQPGDVAGGPPPPSGLGTDLFAIAGQNGLPAQNGQASQKTSSSRSRVGVLVLMGVAALALVVIVILAVSAFTG